MTLQMQDSLVRDSDRSTEEPNLKNLHERVGRRELLYFAAVQFLSRTRIPFKKRRRIILYKLKTVSWRLLDNLTRQI